MAVQHEYEQSVRHVGPSGWLPYAAAGILALIGFIALGAYNAKEQLEAAEPKPASIAAISANPADFIGRAATVNGRAVQVLSPNYYTLTDTGGELLVYSPGGNPYVLTRERHPMLAAGDVVRAVGDIKRYDPPAASLAVNSNFARFKGRPILQAHTNSITSPAVLPPNVYSPKPPIPVVSDLRTIAFASNREVMVGRRVQVSNVTVERVISDRGFWVRMPDNKLLFCRLERALDDGQMEYLVQVKENQIATLNGVLAKPPSASFMDQKWDLESHEALEVAAFKIYLKVDGLVLSRPLR